VTAYIDITSLCLAAGGDMIWDVCLSIGIMASVALLVVAVFSQGGQVQLSPQRQVAIETGHSDRKTIFENAALRPLMWMLLSLAHRLNLPQLKNWLAGKLVAAGSPNYYTPEEYLALAMATGLLLALALGLVWFLVLEETGITVMLLGFGLGFMLSIVQIYNQASKRLTAIAKRVPYSLDLIALAMGAGATFTEAIKTVVQDGDEDPFHSELNAVLAEIELGTTRRRAMENLAERVPLDSVRSIVASVVQAEELGTPLHDVLHNEATLMRLHRSVRAENAAAVASVRILLPGLLILFGVILAVFGPAIVRALEGGSLL
jgi:tight adherence protein C